MRRAALNAAAAGAVAEAGGEDRLAHHAHQARGEDARLDQGGAAAPRGSRFRHGLPYPKAWLTPRASDPGRFRPMRAVIQRVSRASVTVEGEVKGAIERGLVVLLGVAAADTAADVEWLAQKTLGLRIFEDEAGKMNLDVTQVGGVAAGGEPVHAHGRRAERQAAGLHRGHGARRGQPALRGLRGPAARAGRPRSPPASFAPTWRSRWSTTGPSRCCSTRPASSDRSQDLIRMTGVGLQPPRQRPYRRKLRLPPDKVSRLAAAMAAQERPGGPPDGAARAGAELARQGTATWLWRATMRASRGIAVGLATGLLCGAVVTEVWPGGEAEATPLYLAMTLAQAGRGAGPAAAGGRGGQGPPPAAAPARTARRGWT